MTVIVVASALQIIPVPLNAILARGRGFTVTIAAPVKSEVIEEHNASDNEVTVYVVVADGLTLKFLKYGLAVV